MEICDLNSCVGCGSCQSVCPKNAVSLRLNERGFWSPVVDDSQCIHCGLCQKSCPCLVSVERNEVATCLKAYTNDAEVLAKSSSGGLATEFYRRALERGYWVAGVKFNDDFSVSHLLTQNANDLELFYGSKYIPAYTPNLFRDVKNRLESSPGVFFIGTPCQIAGLKAYLKRDYDNLITCDFICYGVGSLSVFFKAINRWGALKNSVVKRLFFRSKLAGYKHNGKILVEMVNKDVYHCPFFDDFYCYGFGTRLFVRSSCDSCRYVGTARTSDITLADYRGKLTSVEEEKGASLCLLNSSKGEKIFNEIASRITFQKVEKEDVLRFATQLTKLVPPNSKKEEFFNAIKKLPFDVVVQKYLIPKKRTFAQKFKNRIKSAIKGVLIFLRLYKSF